jgi:hypothetical protein
MSASAATGMRSPAAQPGPSATGAESSPCSAEPQGGSEGTAAAAGAAPQPGDSSKGTTGPTSASLIRDAVVSHLGTLLELACTALCVLSELVDDLEWKRVVREKEPALLLEALRAGVEVGLLFSAPLTESLSQHTELARQL